MDEEKVLKLDDKHYGYVMAGGWEYRMSLGFFDVQVRDVTVARVMRRALPRIRRDLAPFFQAGGWISPEDLGPYFLAAQPRRGPHPYRVLLRFGNLARMYMLRHLMQEQTKQTVQETARETIKQMREVTDQAIKTTQAAIECAHAFRAQVVQLQEQRREAIDSAHAWRAEALRLQPLLAQGEEDAEDEAAFEAQVEQACHELERQGRVIGVPQPSGQTLWCLPERLKRGRA